MLALLNVIEKRGADQKMKEKIQKKEKEKREERKKEK